MDYCVITFASSNGAIQAQKYLKGHVSFQIMPVLREISRGCGISVRLAPGDLEESRSILSVSDLPPEEYAFYGITGQGPALQATALHYPN